MGQPQETLLSLRAGKPINVNESDTVFMKLQVSESWIKTPRNTTKNAYNFSTAPRMPLECLRKNLDNGEPLDFSRVGYHKGTKRNWITRLS